MCSGFCLSHTHTHCHFRPALDPIKRDRNSRQEGCVVFCSPFYPEMNQRNAKEKKGKGKGINVLSSSRLYCGSDHCGWVCRRGWPQQAGSRPCRQLLPHACTDGLHVMGRKPPLATNSRSRFAFPFALSQHFGMLRDRGFSGGVSL